MKILYKILFASALLSTLNACHQYEPLPENYQTKYDWSADKATYTIQEFINTFLTKNGVLTPVRQNSGTAGLYSVDTLPSSGEDIILRGRVVSSDVAGNIYKTLYIQDEKHPEQGLKISVDAGSLSGLYPVGQLVAIRCNGLALGKYAEMPQLGVAYFNTDKENQGNGNTEIINGTDTFNVSGWKPGSSGAKIGWEIGRIPIPTFKKAIQTIGLPEPQKIIYTETTINEIISSTDYNNICSRIVKIKDVWFNQKSQNQAMDEPDKIFAPETGGIGYPQSRDIEDGSGKTISIATSEYAKFAKAGIPSVDFKGSVTAIIAWYHDKASGSGSWQLTIRSLDDLELKSDDNSTWRADNIYYPNY